MTTARDRAAQLSLAFRFYVVRSVSLDVETARMHAWPRRSRARFLASKSVALVRILSGRDAYLAVGDARVRVARLADLGTVQASLIDVHDDLLLPALLTSDSPTVVDVGANMGQFTTAIKTFWPGASVLAFEPDPDVHSLLQDNARRLGNVRTAAVALGDAPSSLPLHRHAISAMSTLRPGLVETYVEGDVVMVPVVRLDDVTSDLGHVDLLKIDVEGFEVEALRGATELLGRTSLLLVEISLGRVDEPTEPEVMSLITSVRPAARVVGRGRLIGGEDAPICQDVLIDLTGELEPTQRSR